jgi:hypothetical protein
MGISIRQLILRLLKEVPTVLLRTPGPITWADARRPRSLVLSNQTVAGTMFELVRAPGPIIWADAQYLVALSDQLVAGSYVQTPANSCELLRIPANSWELLDQLDARHLVYNSVTIERSS